MWLNHAQESGVHFDLFLCSLHSFALSVAGIFTFIGNILKIKVRMSGNYILPEHDDMDSLVS